MIVKYIRIIRRLSLSPDEFRFPRFPGYEATKSHSQRDPERPRNPKRLDRERYDLPRITSYQFGLRCCRGIVAASESPERDPWNSRLQDPGSSEAKNSIAVQNRGCSASLRVSVRTRRSFSKRYKRIFSKLVLQLRFFTLFSSLITISLFSIKLAK